MSGTEDTGFFRFDTNAGVVANDIAVAMERINATLSHPLPATQLTSVTEGFGKGLENIQGVVAQRVPEIKKLFNDLSTGAIRPEQFKAQWEGMLRSTVGSIPTMYAQAIGNLNDRALAGTAPWAAMSKVTAQDAVAALNAAFRAEASHVDLKTLLQGTQMNNLLGHNVLRGYDKVSPVAFGSEVPGSLAALRNQQLIESFVRQDKEGTTQALAQLERELGIREATQALRTPITGAPNPRGGYMTEGDNGRQFVATRNLTAMIREAEAAAKAYAVAGTEDVAVMNAQAQAAIRAGEAMATLGGEFRKVSQGYINTQTGQLFHGTTGAEIVGAQAERARQELADIQAAEAKAQELAARSDYRLVGGHGVVGAGAGREVYSLSEEKSQARLVDLGLQRNAILDQEDAKLKRNTDQIAREAEAEAALNKERETAQRVIADPSYRRSGSFGITGYGDERQFYSMSPDRSRATELTALQQGKINELVAAEKAEIDASVAARERELAIADKQLATELERARVLAVNAEKQAAQSEAGASGAFLGRFTRGQDGVLNGIAAQIGSAASFTLAYGSLFALSGVMHGLLGQFLDYQDSVTDLQVATRNADTVTGDWVNSLSELSRLSGANMGQAMDTAARGIRAFTDAATSPQDVRDAGTATVDAATKLAVIGNKTMTDATGDLVAAGSAFSLAPDQLNQVVDAVANAKRNVGGDAAQISQGLALIGLAAQNAGYSLNEAAAIIGLVQARTDESGQAIATRLTRVFQIVNGSTGKGLAAELGVDPNASVKDQLADYAKIYANPKTPEATRDRIASSLGGTANLREILPLLKEGSTLQAAFKEAMNNAGQGTDEFNRKLHNLVGTFKLLRGDVSNISVGLAKSGLFNFVGGIAVTLEPALYSVDKLIKALNVLTGLAPDWVPKGLGKDILGLAVDLAILAKVVGVVSASKANRKLAAEGGRTEAEAKQIEAINAATQARIAAEERLTAATLAAAKGRFATEEVAATGGARGAAESTEVEVIAAATEERVAAENTLISELAAAGAERVAAENARNAELTAVNQARLALEEAQNNEIAALVAARVAAEQYENEVIAAATRMRLQAATAAAQGDTAALRSRLQVEAFWVEEIASAAEQRIAAETAETAGIRAITIERLQAANTARGADLATVRERIAVAQAENEAIAAAAAERVAVESAAAEGIATLTAARLAAEEEEATVIALAAAGRYRSEALAAGEIRSATAYRIAAETAENEAIAAAAEATAAATAAMLQAAAEASGASGAALQERIAAAQAETEGIVASTEARLAAEAAETEGILAAGAARLEAEAAAAAAVAAGGAAGAEGAVAGGVVAGTMGRGFGAMRAGFMGNPALILGLVAGYIALSGLGKYQEHQDLLHTQQKDVANSLRAYTRIDGSVESLQAAANDFRSVAGQVKKSGLPGYLKDDGASLVRDSNMRARELDVLAKRVAKEEELAQATQKMNFFGNGAIETTTELAQGMDAVARAGGTALTAWQALAKQLNTPPPPQGEQWRPEALNAEIIQGIHAALPKVLARNQGLAYDATDLVPTPEITGNAENRAKQRYAAMLAAANEKDPKLREQMYRALNNPAGETSPDVIASHLNAFTGDTDRKIRAAIAAKTAQLGLNTMEGLAPSDKAKLIRAAVMVIPNFKHLGKQAKSIVEQTIGQTVDDLTGRVTAADTWASVFDDKKGFIAPKKGKFDNVGISDHMLNSKKISRDDLVKLMSQGPANEDGSQWQGLEAYMRAAQQALPENDDGTKLIALLHNQIATLKGRIKAAADDGKPVKTAELLLSNLMHEERKSIVDRLDALRLAAESRAKTQKELTAVRRSYALREVKHAHGDATILKPLFESLDRQTINYVIQTLKAARATARMAVETAENIINQAMQLLAQNPFAGMAGIEGLIKSTGIDKLRQHYDNLNQDVKDAYGALHGATIGDLAPPDPSSGSGSGSSSGGGGSAADAAQSHADKIAAMAEAHAAYLGGGLAAARAAIIGARAQVNAAKKGTTEYFQALASLYQAQWQMKEALEAFHFNQYQLQGDMTDPVEQARDALRAAREKLRNARSKDDKAAAKVEVKQDETALEKAKWDQKLSDMQTAEQLGRISYQTYIRYLERESERMHKMHHKTRQQIDHMNEIDLALKDATDAAGQFNLGDIDMRGFVYTVRRLSAAQEQAHKTNTLDALQQANASQVNSNNVITINGTDVHMVRKILREMLGDAAPRRGTTHRRS